ncbi:MAG: hypothetical protein Q8P31_13470 [Bacillota bacterium]|nr:hypothetical protein [Bacillota bacterium]
MRLRGGPAGRRIALCLALVVALGGAAAGCLPWALGGRGMPFRTVAYGSPGGVREGYEDALMPLLTVPGGYVLASDEHWARLRDALNRGAGAEIYDGVDFARYVLLVYFHGPGGHQGDQVVVQSLRASGERVRADFRLERGASAAGGFPYLILAIHRNDLAGARSESRPWTFDFRAGGRQVVALSAPIDPPAPGEAIVAWPSPRIIGQGVPQDWAPGGSTILVARDQTRPPDGTEPVRPGIFAGNPVGGGTQTALFVPESGSAGAARYSPDGRLVALLYLTGGKLRLLVVPADGSAAPRDLTPGGTDLAAPAVWAPDGQSLLVAGRESGGQRQYVLLSVPVSSPGTALRLYSQAAGLTSPWWAGDGTIYFLRQTSQGSVLAARPAAGGPAGDLLSAVRYALSPDARWLAYVAETAPGEGSLRVLPVAALTPGGPAGIEMARGVVGSPAWSPDARELAFTWRTPGQPAETTASDLWMARPDGNIKQRLSSGAGTGDVGFSPDGTRISFALYPGSWLPGEPRSLVAVLDLRSK